jgi:hypothetical protein
MVYEKEVLLVVGDHHRLLYLEVTLVDMVGLLPWGEWAMADLLLVKVMVVVVMAGVDTLIVAVHLEEREDMVPLLIDMALVDRDMAVIVIVTVIEE